ncbi:restriction endonuclease subunit S [Runella aurantiaca]|uniref:Restriction endonuclease subunit S n=1 Tax=Runella aurantiaca TaxID=2282308 RepID=A0A369IB94_9BACT|nr:restriction endonuclease subunit S [Runella aurantiaca]RDB06908.1 restriction endonuclease subunit S [Runella aurantiaca]
MNHLRNIPSDWEILELKEITEKIMVGIASAATHAYRNTGVILFRNQNIKEGFLDDSDLLFIDEAYERVHKNKRLKSGDILIARTGYPGTACLVPDLYNGAQSFTTLIARPYHNIVNKEYLCFYINSELGQGYFELNQIGGGQKNVNAGTLEFMPIPSPPLPEQKAIASCLSTWDEAIQKSSQLITQKELRKKWLMQQLLTGKKRLKGFSGEWKEVRFGDITLNFSRRNKGLIDAKVYSVTNTNGFVLQSDHFEREVAGNDLSNYKIIKRNEFAYNPARINVGSLAYFEDEVGIISSLYVCFSTKKDILDYYLLQFLRLEHTKHRIESLGEGGVRVYLWYDLIAKIKVKLPSLEEQTAIAQILQTADKEIELLKNKLCQLKEQKKGLMQVLLTGKKRLKL